MGEAASIVPLIKWVIDVIFQKYTLFKEIFNI